MFNFGLIFIKMSDLKNKTIGILQELGLEGWMKNLQVIGDEVVLDMVSHSPTMHERKKLEIALKTTFAERMPEARLKLRISIDVPQKPVEIKGQPIEGVKNIIAVASGKGGVGKSTVTANLAVSLQKMGFKVGLLDADIYGPSMPTMFDLEGEKPFSVKINGVNKMGPVENYGIKLLSIGFFVSDADQAVVWRGPMASKALKQMIWEAHWGDLDFLLIDLPPGTGDIHLSIVQQVPVTGAVIVSTPQHVALADVRKGVAMFNMEAINVPVLGVIENMSYFTPAELPENKYYIFGKDGARTMAQKLNIPFLGEIPLIQSIREASDIGRPAALQDNTSVSEIYEKITQNMVESLVERNKNLPPTEAVRITTMAGCSEPRKF